MAILAIDQGTSSTKAVILDEQFQVVAKAGAPLQVEHNQSGASQIDGELIWQSLVAAVTQVLTQIDLSMKLKISAVGLANQGESVLAWDKNTGQPLTPVIIWQDSRSDKLCKERIAHQEFVQSRTGLTIDPYFVAPKILWLRNQYPNLGKDAVITTTDTWLIYRLTNQYVTDKATASRSLLFDLESCTWQQELADIWQIDIDQLPSLVNNDQVIGAINNPQLPALTGVMLTASIVDQPAALLAQNCLSAGQAKCTFGTGAFLLTNIGDQIKISTTGLATSLAWQIKDAACYYLDGQLFTAATAIDWLISNQFIKDISELDKLPEAEGVIASPSFAGIGAPLWRPNATATILGLGLNHGKANIASAVVDGLAAGVAELLNAGKSDGVVINALRVDGGLAQSAKLMQRQADLAQLPIEVYAHPDATAIGVGYLAALGSGQINSLSQVGKYWQPSKTYSPNWSADQAINYLARWRATQAVSLDRE
jgi:glycerol kinase